MTPEELERLAREAGFSLTYKHDKPGTLVLPIAMFARFAALVRAQALTDAANVAESWQDYRGVLSSVGPRIARAIKEQP